ncbi:MAG TPA: phosphatidate cytidylyltransferase [Opitutaceae bacterium]|nr:phosphatidate cytidylyltransferase [Opitutaceae bacterium]
MLQRILSTVLLWVVAIATLHYLGAPGAVWLITLLACATQFEFYRMLKRTGLDPFDRLGLTMGALIVLAPYYLEDSTHRSIQTTDVLAVAVVLFALRILGEREPHNRMETLAATLFGVLYVPFMLQFLVRTIVLYDDPDTGLALGLWLVAVAKFCDVGALLTGLAFGRHKMAPNISPKKTWEGAVGGLLVSAGVGALLARLGRSPQFGGPYFPDDFTPLRAALMALPIAAAAITSDLVESIIKRRAEVKDTGQFIPGIGGAFDLTDSLILAAPIGYFLFYFCLTPDGQ